MIPIAMLQDWAFRNGALEQKVRNDVKLMRRALSILPKTAAGKAAAAELLRGIEQSEELLQGIDVVDAQKGHPS